MSSLLHSKRLDEACLQWHLLRSSTHRNFQMIKCETEIIETMTFTVQMWVLHFLCNLRFYNTIELLFVLLEVFSLSVSRLCQKFQQNLINQLVIEREVNDRSDCRITFSFERFTSVTSTHSVSKWRFAWLNDWGIQLEVKIKTMLD